MRSLCHAMLGRSEPRPDDELDHFDMERVLEVQAEEQLEKDAVAEIDRYRRMDEWSSSFQNLYSRAALQCQMEMMQAKIQPLDPMRFIPYTRSGTYDLLRLQAFECLVELDVSKGSELLRWLIFTMSSDSSALIRRRCQALLGQALAQIAFGRPQEEETNQAGGLIIEQESSTEVRQADLARRQTVPGAIEALKQEVFGDTSFKEYLWAACNSASIGLLELSQLLDICRILFDPRTSRVARLKYPRFWKVEHLGNGRMHFYRSDRLRMSLAPSKDTTAAKRKREEQGMPPPAPRITFKQSKTAPSPGTPSMARSSPQPFPKIHIPNPASTPNAGPKSAAATPSTPASGGLKLKLKFGQKSK